jgi:uncharacterized protein
VKSFLGESLDQLHFDRRGAEGDRLYAVHNVEGKFGSGKTTRRFRLIEGLFGFRAYDQDGVPVVIFPSGQKLRGDDPLIHAMLSATLGQPVTLTKEADVSHFEAGPVHLLTTASLDWLRSQLSGSQIDERRFRPNIVIRGGGSERVEDHWLGQRLSIGGAELVITSKTERCVMVTFAQSELEPDPRVLKTVAKLNDVCLGVYADVVKPGGIRVGDELRFV